MKLYSNEDELQELNTLYQKAAAELYDKQQKEAFLLFIERFSDIYLNAYGITQDGEHVKAFINSIIDNNCNYFSSFIPPLKLLDNKNKEYFSKKIEEGKFDITDTSLVTEKIIDEIRRESQISEEEASHFLQNFCQKLWFLLNSPKSSTTSNQE